MKSQKPAKKIVPVVPVVLAVAVLAGLVLIFLYIAKKPSVSPFLTIGAGTGETPKQAPAPVSAPKGETVTGFPKELILDSAADLGSSYSLNYNANLNQYTASYISKLSMSRLFDMYKSYYQKNSWAVTNEITKYPSSRGLYAVKGTVESSVAVIDEGAARNVIVNYLKK